MLKDARNDLIHCGEMPGPKELSILIEEVLQLEKDLEIGDRQLFSPQVLSD
jgi:hypothetical protein